MLKSGSFFDDAFKHIDVSAVMDLLYRLVNVPSQQQDSDFVKEWYTERNFAGRLADLFVPSQSSDVHSNASNLWSEMIRVLRDLQYTTDEKRPDVLLDSLQGTDALRTLLSNMFPQNEPVNESVVVNGSIVLITLLQTNYIPNSPEHLAMGASDAQPSWVGGPGAGAGDGTVSSDQVWQPDATRLVETVLCERLEAISSYLTATTQARPLRLPMGEVKQPLGNGKISIVKLIASLLNTNHPPTHQRIVEMDLLKNLLRNAYEFPFSNFLHLAVVQCVQYVLFSRLPSDTTPLIRHLLVYCRLPESLLDHAGSDDKQSTRILRVQLKAHTMNLANWLEIARLRGPNKETITSLLDELGMTDRWSSFVESVLVPYQKANESDNVDLPSSGASGLMGETEMPGSDAAGNQAFSDYQMQSMTSAMPEHFGLPMDTFTSVADNEIDALAAKANMVDFNVKEQLDDTPSGEASFEALCAIRISGAALPDRRSTIIEPFGFNEKPEDAWPGEQTSSSSGPFGAKFDAFPVTWNESTGEPKTEAQSSSKMDVDKDDWPTGKTEGKEDAGWADFGAARATPQTSSGASGDAWANFDQLGSRADFVSPVCIGIAAATSLSNTTGDPLLKSPGKSGSSPSKSGTESTC
uniref:Uncharacterized protein n=1 Tax=Plectus sambesii TaxID=2011161 RepID=A0A914WD13_9BILA